MKNLKEVLKNESEFIKNHGGYWNLTEFHGGINDLQREKIKAFKEYYGQCFFGKVNYYDNERKNIDNVEILTEYTNQLVCNFEYAFCIPVYDETLINMIREYNKESYSGKIMNLIEAILKRIDKLEGITFIWV